MKKLFTFLFVIGFLFSTNIFAQYEYWTEDWNDEEIEGRLTGTTSDAPTVFTDAYQVSGTWSCIYAIRAGGTGRCDAEGRTLRLLKVDPASRTQGGAAITPPLDEGVGKVIFVEGRGGDNRIIEVSKSTDNGSTWEVVTTLNGTTQCVFIEVVVEDINANRIKLENKGTGDIDLDDITVTSATPVSVEIDPFAIPTEYLLHQNHPNPFNPSTVISFSLPKAGEVQVIVYDQLGREVSTLFNGFKNAGNHNIVWNTADHSSKLSSGIYIVQLKSADIVRSIKAVLLK